MKKKEFDRQIAEIDRRLKKNRKLIDEAIKTGDKQKIDKAKKEVAKIDKLAQQLKRDLELKLEE